MNTAYQFSFTETNLQQHLDQADDGHLDTLDFGVIAFDAEGIVRRYNSFESNASGLSVQRVLGNNLFEAVAPCMNNFMIAQRFEDAREESVGLDDTINYVLTLRMRPVKVQLRLLAAPDSAMRYVLVCRPS